MALDQWFPTRFTLLSDRLVSQNGVLLMGVLAGTVLLLTGASVHYLVVLYSITVFITFVLSQAGLVRHWWATRGRTPHWKRRFLTASTALALCAFILVVVTVLKFFEGGWITLIVLGGLVGLALLAKRHYASVAKTLKKMDSLVQAARASQGSMASISANTASGEASGLKYDPKAKTAVMLVSGFDGPGLHTLFSIIRGTNFNFQSGEALT
jgi:amino acid transporter